MLQYHYSCMIKLSDNFTYKKLLRFATAPILMMICISVYSVVDGLFVSNFVGKDAFTAINLVFPYIMVLGAVGFMFGAGGSAIVSKTIGEGKNQLAKSYFSLVTLVAVLSGIVLAVAGILLLQPVSVWMGAEGEVLPLCKTYGTIILCALPFFVLQNMYQSFFATAQKPRLGFVVTVASGVTNILLDALFVVGLKWGIAGAAVGTAMSQFVGGVVPTIYFFSKNKSLLNFCPFRWNGRLLLKVCTNGSSELLGNIAMSLVAMLYNKQLMRLVGDSAVDAYGVMQYVQFVFVAVFIGYCLAVTPVIGFNFGAQNRRELQNVFSKSLVIIAVTAVAMVGSCFALADVISHLFVGYDSEMHAMTVHGMYLYCICFAFVGFNMFGSSFFTALNNGLISAILSFGRTLVFQVACIYILPLWWGLDGIWLSTVVAEFLSLMLTVTMFLTNNRRYGYLPSKNKKSAV